MSDIKPSAFSVEICDEAIWTSQATAKKGYKFSVKIRFSDGRFFLKLIGCRVLRSSTGSNVFCAAAGSGKRYWDTSLWSISLLQSVIDCVRESAVYQTALSEDVINPLVDASQHPSLPTIDREV